MDIWYFESRRRWERVGIGETNQRYTQLSKNTDIYILGDAPLVLLGRALLYDTKEDKIIGQLKFQSISEKTIIAFKISVIGFDVSNVQIERSEFQYLDLKMKENDVTGSQIPIVFSNKNVRKFVFWISEIVYGDGSIENPSNHELILVEKKLISDVLDKELAEQYKRSLNCKLSDECGTYIPTSYSERAWICSCGKINGIHREKCYRCESEFSDEVKLLNKEYLESQLEEYKKEKELESIEKAKIHQKQVKQLKIGTGIASIVVAVLLVGNLTYKKIIVPKRQYEEAGKLLEEGDYRGAKIIYKELENYKDSKEQMKKSDELIEKRDLYNKAVGKYFNGEKESAFGIFQKMAGYKESYYYMGMIEKDNKNYSKAISYFDKVDKNNTRYKDVNDEKNECYYDWAYEDFEKGKISDGQEKLKRANGINDSVHLLNLIKKELNKEWCGVYNCSDDPDMSLELSFSIYPKAAIVRKLLLNNLKTGEEKEYTWGTFEDDGSLLLNDYDGNSGIEERIYFFGDTITETYRLKGESWDDTELDNGRTHTYVKESDNS